MRTAFRSFFGSYFLIAGLFILFVLMLMLMSTISADADKFQRFWLPMLFFNIGAAVILTWAIAKQFVRLIVQVARKRAGSGLTLRLVALITVITIAPVGAVYGFAVYALNHTIESFFSVRLDKAIGDALRLSRTAIDTTLSNHLNFTKQLANELTKVDEYEYIASVVNKLRLLSNANELTLFDVSGQVIATSSAENNVLIPYTPEKSVFEQLRFARPHAAVHVINDTSMIRIAVPVPNIERAILLALYSLPDSVRTLRAEITETSKQYDALIDVRTSLKNSFVVHLSLTVLLTVLSALLAAMKASRRFIRPITQLASATDAIAQGNYNVRLSTKRRDELGFLVRAFNAMTETVATSTRKIADSNTLLEARNTYLATLLANMSSGVLATNNDWQVTAYNVAASDILGVDLTQFERMSIDTVDRSHPYLGDLFTFMRSHNSSKNMRMTLTTPSGQVTLICRIRRNVDEQIRHLLVFDDVTALLQAQRESAWGEVARRMAHEIRNPLTPIQLSAERLRHKYKSIIPEEAHTEIDSLTRTIVKQVGAIKKMVDAFAEYAKSPQLKKTALSVDRILDEVVALLQSEIRIERRTYTADIVIEADEMRIRQLLTNILKNALEAVRSAHKDEKTGAIMISTTHEEGSVCIRVCDNGCGLPTDIKHDVFEPYVSSKHNGTGLGLAICKRIVEEHDGTIELTENTPSGVCVTVRLPSGITTS